MTLSSPPPAPPADAARPSADEMLERVAMLLVASRPDAQPALVGIELIDDDVDVHMRPCLVPAEDLLGWTAPAAWDVLGTCATATVRRWSDPIGDATVGDVAVTQTSVVHLVARSGRSVTVLGDGTDTILRDDEAVPGLTSDACRRALGLETAPPAVSAPDAIALLWFDAIAAAATRTPGLDDVACWHLHPALPLATAGSRRDLPTRCLAATERVTWAFLRDQAATGAPSLRVVPSVAAWCDDGAFSRLVLASLPEADDLIEALEALIPAGVAERILATVDGLLD